MDSPGQWKSALLASALILLAPSFGAAQVPREVSSTPSCASCTIRLERVATLGDEDGPGSFASRPYSIARDLRGRYYVVTPETRDEVPFVFDRNGRFLQRLGRAGNGPGEYRAPEVILAAGDSIYVLDQIGRLTVLSPSYDIVRSTVAPRSAMGAVHLGDGTLVVNALVRDRDRVGFTLHYLDVRGGYIRSVDLDSLTFNPRNVTARVRRLAQARGNLFWSAPYIHRYALNLWDGDGHLLQGLRRNPDWFPPFDDPWTTSPDRPPVPIVMGIWEDSRGYVWVIARVGSRDWASGLGPGMKAEGAITYPHKDDQRVFDTVVEVIDPIAGRLVTSTRISGTLDLVIEPDLVAAIREADSGSLKAEILRVHLAER